MGKIFELGAFNTDLTQVIRQLREDLKDDWFPDSLGYEDILKPDVAGSLLIAALERHHGRFVPESRMVLNIPKQSGGLRYSLEMSLQDRLYYQVLVGFLIPFYDALLPNRVLSHRYARSERRSNRYLFKHPVEQWTHFNNYVAQEAHTKPIVLATDIQSYYEYISLEQVFDVLDANIERLPASWLEKAQIRAVLEELKRCLPAWTFTPSQGLPQNRDASSFLANLAMLPVDQAMISRGYSYYRYMDDIRVAARTLREAQEALEFLIIQLRDRGLSINFSKNRILEPGKEGYEEIRGRATPLLVEIYNMWQSRSVHVIRRSFAPLQRLAEDLIKRKATHERAFRFCMNKFKNIALCPELGAPKAYFDPMINACIQQLDEQPSSSDQLIKFLKAAPTSAAQISEVARLLIEENRSKYDWQNYLLWGLLVYKGYKSVDLLRISKKRILEIEGSAERSGAILYLGAMGSLEDRIFLSRKFESFGEHLAQRNALIAIHEINFNMGIKENVKEHILPSLEGTYRRLREGFFGQYFRPLARIPLFEICDEVSSYD